MPLEGDLKEFGVSEIFQLLEHQDKTGCLLLSMEASQVEVYFLKGRIVGAIPDGQTPSDYLLDTLEKLGFLSDSEEAGIRELYGKDLRGLPEILQQRNILEHQEMDLVLRDRIKEILFPVFTSRHGRFLFDPDRTLSSEWALAEPLPVEPIILEGLRRTDEWPVVKRKIGSLRAVPRRRLSLEETGKLSWVEALSRFVRRQPSSLGDDLPEKDLFPTHADELSSVERIVYNLIDGKRTVEEIVWASSLGEYGCCKTLLDLRDRGRIQMDPVQAERGVSVSGVGVRGLGRWGLTAAGLIVLFLGVSYFSRSVPATWVRKPTGEGVGSVSRLLNQHQRARVMRAVEIYREEQGTVPVELSELVRAHLLREDDLALWGDNLFSYKAEPPDAVRLLIVPAD